MARTVGIGYQDFETIRKNDYFYIDNTLYQKMVGGRGQRNADYPAAEVWENPEYEHAGKVFLHRVCWQGGSL